MKLLKTIKHYGPFFLIWLLPLFVLANQHTVGDVLVTFLDILSVAVAVVIGIAVLVFIWGLIQYLTAGDDAEKKKAARTTMIYGVIIIFVMVSVWGLVVLLHETFPGTRPPPGGPRRFFPWPYMGPIQ